VFSLPGYFDFLQPHPILYSGKEWIVGPMSCLLDTVSLWSTSLSNPDYSWDIGVLNLLFHLLYFLINFHIPNKFSENGWLKWFFNHQLLASVLEIRSFNQVLGIWSFDYIAWPGSWCFRHWQQVNNHTPQHGIPQPTYTYSKLTMCQWVRNTCPL